MIDLGQATNLGEIIDAARSAEGSFCQRQLWFRGHSDAHWKLVPTAHRRPPILESQMAQLFRMRAPSLHSRCPEHSNYAGWLPLMRHYGLPTRLLDWSESLCVATYFAAKMNMRGGPGVVWMLSPGHLNLQEVGDFIPFLTDPRVQPLAEAAFSLREGIPVAIAAHAPRDNPRMVAQLGNFTIHGHTKALDDDPRSTGFLARLELPACALDRIRSDLQLAGVRLSSLFPDLQHLAEEISELEYLGSNVEGLDAG